VQLPKGRILFVDINAHVVKHCLLEQESLAFQSNTPLQKVRALALKHNGNIDTNQSLLLNP
jgi:hypothetical protein